MKKRCLILIVIFVGLLFCGHVYAEEKSPFEFTDEEWHMIERFYENNRTEIADNMSGLSESSGYAAKEYIPDKEDAYFCVVWFHRIDYSSVTSLSELNYDDALILLNLPTGETSCLELQKKEGRYSLYGGSSGGSKDDYIRIKEMRQKITALTGEKDPVVWITLGCAASICGDKEIMIPLPSTKKDLGLTRDWYYYKDFLKILNEIEFPEEPANLSDLQYTGYTTHREKAWTVFVPAGAGILLAVGILCGKRKKNRAGQ